MNSKIQQSGRDKLLDIAKGIGIILVILGHSIQFGSGSKYIGENLFFNNIYFIIIYSFHMTLFCTISGYLFSKLVSLCAYPRPGVFYRGREKSVEKCERALSQCTQRNWKICFLLYLLIFFGRFLQLVS